MTTIDVDVFLAHPVDRVWFALTDARQLSTWLLPTDLVSVVGASFSLIGGEALGLPEVIRGEVTSVVANTLMSMVWRADIVAARVLWEVVPTDGGCRLRVRQSGLIDRRDIELLRARFAEALPRHLDEMEFAAAIAPPPAAVMLDFGAEAAGGSGRIRRRAAIVAWPRHRVAAAIAGAVALLVLVGLFFGGSSWLSGSAPSAADPGPGVTGAPPALSTSRPSQSAGVLIGAVASDPPSPLPSRSHPVARASGKSPAPAPATSTVPAASTATYATTDTFDGGYTGQITITVTSAIRSWTATVTLPAGASVTTAWEASYTQHGTTVTFRPESWSAEVTPGSAVTMGFQVAGGSPPHPLTCSVSGQACTGR